jgi:hypothetical protein
MEKKYISVLLVLSCLSSMLGGCVSYREVAPAAAEAPMSLSEALDWIEESRGKGIEYTQKEAFRAYKQQGSPYGANEKGIYYLYGQPLDTHLPPTSYRRYRVASRFVPYSEIERVETKHLGRGTSLVMCLGTFGVVNPEWFEFCGGQVKVTHRNGQVRYFTTPDSSKFFSIVGLSNPGYYGKNQRKIGQAIEVMRNAQR